MVAALCDLERIAQHEAKRQRITPADRRRPEIVLDLVTSEKSVFDERDIAKVLHRYIDDAGSLPVDC